LYICLICTRFERPTFSLDRGFWVMHARAAWPLLIIAIVSTTEGSVDALMLSRNGNTVAVGTYGAATALLSALLIIPGAIRQIILPIMAERYKSEPARAYEVYVHTQRFLLITTLFASTTLVLIADKLLPMLYNHQFHETIQVFQIVLWSFVFISLTIPNGRLLLVVGQQAIAVPIQFASMVLNVALNLLLQPRLGPQGAALARCGSTGLAFVLTLWYVQRHIHHWNLRAALAGPVGAALALALTSVSLRWIGLNWVLALICGWLVYGIALVAFGGISAGEWRALRGFVRRDPAQPDMRGLL
jgi:O-antigen/teichoic acid export membrane protein